MTSTAVQAPYEEKSSAVSTPEHEYTMDKKIEDAQVEDMDSNPVYDNSDVEPEIHARTYIAFLAMFILNYVQVVALQGPPAVLDWIGEDLDGVAAQTWIPNSLSLVQAVLGPVIASASDVFQARKTILVASCLIPIIGSAIAPGSNNIYRLIAAQTLIGVGFAAVPLAYSVPSEILPRRWRPMAQATINIAASLGAITGPLIIGAMTRSLAGNGWRNFYWMQLGLWAVTGTGIFFGYQPPKRHTRYDHLSVWQKLKHLDLPGFGLLTTGLSLFLTGLNLGGSLFSWTNSRTLATLIIGLVLLCLFGLYEWKGTKTGILHHGLFESSNNAGRMFAILVALIFIEGIMLFAVINFYPVLNKALFETDPFLLTARTQPVWVSSLVSAPIWGYIGTRWRTIRWPLAVGCLIFTVGIAALATVNPDDNLNTLIYASITGFGFGAPIILIITGVQLVVPHSLIATATAVTTSSRAIAATVFTAIYAAALEDRLSSNIPNQVGQAAQKAGLAASSIPAFVAALAANDQEALATVPGVSPDIIGAGVVALKHAFADSVRIVYIIAAPFGVLAVILCFFMDSLKNAMNWRVDAPVEKLHAKEQAPGSNGSAA